MPADSLNSIFDMLGLDAVELSGYLLAFARVLPTVLLVPAFGLSAVPIAMRAALGLALMAGTVPALSPPSVAAGPLWLQLWLEAARGLPVALGAAVFLWVASMAGSLLDNLRGSSEISALPTADAGATPSGALLSMLAAVAFLESGGPGRIALALAQPNALGVPLLSRIANNLHSSIEIAVAIAAPLIGVSIVLELLQALSTRVAHPAYLQPVFEPLRALVLLGVLAIVLENVALLLVRLAVNYP